MGCETVFGLEQTDPGVGLSGLQLAGDCQPENSTARHRDVA